ncbi:MAG: peptidoglycan-binding protein, partial [Candidatus Paceibacterota bacterium]
SGGGGSSGGGSSSNSGGGANSSGGTAGGGSISSSNGTGVTYPTVTNFPVCSSGLSISPITSVVGIGFSGENVTNLQKFLAEKGYTSSNYITGYFGPLTQSALQKFQSDEGIVSSGTPETTGYGNAGPSTRARINTSIKNSQSSNCSGGGVAPTASSVPQIQYSQRSLLYNIGRGSEGEDVKILQQFLVGQGYIDTSSVTGYFGPITENAVKSFQRFQNIVSSGTPETTGYGNVGPSTRARINTMLVFTETSTVSAPTTVTSSNLETLQSQIQIMQAQVMELLKQLQ